jgi:hypothetical protein
VLFAWPGFVSRLATALSVGVGFMVAAGVAGRLLPVQVWNVRDCTHPRLLGIAHFPGMQVHNIELNADATAIYGSLPLEVADISDLDDPSTWTAEDFQCEIAAQTTLGFTGILFDQTAFALDRPECANMLAHEFEFNEAGTRMYIGGQNGTALAAMANPSVPSRTVWWGPSAGLSGHVGPVAGKEQVDDAVGDVIVEVVDVTGDQDQGSQELEQGVLQRHVRSELTLGDAALEQVFQLGLLVVLSAGAEAGEFGLSLGLGEQQCREGAPEALVSGLVATGAHQHAQRRLERHVRGGAGTPRATSPITSATRSSRDSHWR